MSEKKIKLTIIILIVLLLMITIGVFLLPNDKQTKEETKYELVDKKMYLLFDDTVYESDSINSVHKIEISKGSEVHVEECNNTGWCKITVDDCTGYVQKNLLSEEKINEEVNEPEIEEPEEPEEKDQIEESTPEVIIEQVNETVYASTDANIRSEMNYGNNVVGVLKFNESITRIGIIGEWSLVRYNDQDCYIVSSVLMKNKIERKPINTNVVQDGTIDPSKPMVALTFDDGPGLSSTTRILDTLEKYNVKATFFDLGYLMAARPDIVKREATLGEVGTHTYNHTDLNKATADLINNDLNKVNNIFINILGTKPTLLRPPYGNANATVKSLITDMAIINWNVDTLDWKTRNSEQIINKVISAGDLNGDIILFHSIYESTADAIEYIVPYLINEGYQIVTVSELATYKGVALTTGLIYYHF